MKQTRKKGRADRKLLIILIGLILLIIVLTVLDIMLAVKTQTEHAFGALAEPYQRRLETEMNRLWMGYQKVVNTTKIVLALFDGLDNIEAFEQAEIAAA